MTTVAKSVYDDFSAPTPFRSARVIVEGRSVYVNPGWLAEFSNFFATMFFGKSADEDLTLGVEIFINRISRLGASFDSLMTTMLRYMEQVRVLAWHIYVNRRECSDSSNNGRIHMIVHTIATIRVIAFITCWMQRHVRQKLFTNPLFRSAIMTLDITASSTESKYIIVTLSSFPWGRYFSNVIVVLKMAHYFGMKSVIEECEDIIVKQASTLDRVKLFQIACAVAEHDRYSPTMTLLIDKLSAMKREELSKLHFSQVPGDVVADVFAAKMKRREMKRKKWCCLS
ncbi:unnamed protein product [Acanthocheilonema viteae]|uniref:BTB domain-containing protein n=1 Tax=Acanthocheilonema viteae TaxID=6277 RepID=A0A498SIS1_ACAVI|nr:unnamed protein product [Acanthocheilonema viteae]